jgi:hypothetical protein
MRRGRGAVLVLLGLAAPAACALDASTEKNRCNVDEDCNTGRVCAAGVCRDRTVADAGGDTGAGGGGAAKGADASTEAPALAPAELAISPHDAGFGDVGLGGKNIMLFSVHNNGEATSAPPTPTLGGDDPGAFMITGDTCSNAPLYGGAGCIIAVAFEPTALGAQSASLTVEAPALSPVTATLHGVGVTPASLSLTPAPGSSADFGDVVLGTYDEETFVVSNTGDDTASPVAISLVGDTGDFAVLVLGPPCLPSDTTIPGHSSCTIGVRFSPVVPGPRQATLSAAIPGGAPSTLELTGGGDNGALLTGDASGEFEGLEVGVAGYTMKWMVRNAGDGATGTLRLDNGDPAEIVVGDDSCTGSLDAGASCMVSLTFAPSGGGMRAGTVRLSAAPGGAVTFTATAEGLFRVQVSRAGGGSVSLQTPGPSVVTCSTADCPAASALVEPGSTVTASASTTNGSDIVFAGWSGGVCSGVARTCTFTVNGTTNVGTAFVPVTNNLVFVTSAAFPSNLGSAAAYDADCNAFATAAGINDAAGDGFVAFVSDTKSKAVNRLGSARGWVRLDGRPFADTLGSLLTSHVLYNAVSLDDTGTRQQSSQYITGTASDGTLTSATCAGWTSTSGSASATIGQGEGGPFNWTGAGTVTCDTPHQLLCMGKTKTVPLTLPGAGKGPRIWLSNTPFIPGGGQTPTAKCLAERPAGVNVTAPLLALTTQAASAVLFPAASYYRPDGTLVGTGAQIATSGDLESGIWQAADGSYRSPRVWTGEVDLMTPSTAAYSCSNWTSAALGSGFEGAANTAAGGWWAQALYPCSDTTASLYCVEGVPTP